MTTSLCHAEAMKRSLWSLSLIALMVGCSQTPAPAPEIDQEALSFQTAVWTYADLVTQSKARSAFYTFASSHPIKTIYLEAEDHLNNRPAALAGFVQDARSRKFNVELLTGHPHWALPEFQNQGVQFAQKVVQLANQYPQAQGIGLHLDVEPYLLPEWQNNPQQVANGLLDLFAQVKNTLQSQPLAVDIPCWFDEIQVLRNGQTRPLSEWIIDVADLTVLMDYRDTVQGIVNSGYSEIEYASKVGKKVVLGVNTKNERGLSPASTTFYEEGWRYMESTLNTVNQTLQPKSGYGGLAIFTYEDYKLLKK